MSIDARVRAVYLHEDGGGTLELEDRPARQLAAEALERVRDGGRLDGFRG